MSIHQPVDRQGAAPVPPPAIRSTLRLRHRFLIFSFFVLVAMPVYTVGWYLYTRAADQYASNLGFSVRTEESGSAIELLGGVTELSGSSSSDSWRDPVFTFNPVGRIEDLLAHWERKVTIHYDNSTGMIDLRILAFQPDDAQRIAHALYSACSEMINNLSAVAREDAIKYARDELQTAVLRLKEARKALTSYRNRNQIVDPSIDTASRMGLLTTLQRQLAEALIELDLLRDSTRDSDPRVVQATKRVSVIETRIAAERQKLGLGASGEAKEAFADLVGEYEGLIVDREFAETAYTAALATFDSAQAEAQKQSRYLAAHITPTLAESAEYPERLKILALFALFAAIVWSIAVLIYYSLRDRR